MTSGEPAATLLPAIVRAHQAQLLDDWIAHQLAAADLRLDRITEKDLRADSQAFLRAFAQALDDRVAASDLEAPAWHPVTELLAELSGRNDEKGFSSAETATFVFSFKQPLLQLLHREVPEDRWLEEMWLAITLLDRLGLYTTEVHQQRKEATIRRQRDELVELSTPVVKLWDGILALPLIGTLDTTRSQFVTERLLESIANTGSEIAILDLTGVPVVDTRMAQHLLRTVAATRLMGADCILCGISPQIAQTMVHLEIDLGNIETAADLAGALEVGFRRIGIRVTSAGS